MARETRFVIVLGIIILLGLLVTSTAEAAPPRILATSTGNSVATTTHVVTLPGFGIVSPGDVWFACVDTNANMAVTIPAGWSLISQGTQSLVFTCAYKYFASGDSSTVTFTTTGVTQDAWVSVLVTGSNSTYRTYGTISVGGDANPNPPQFTVEPASNVVMFEAFAGGNSAFCDETSLSAGYSLTDVRQENGVISATVAVASKTGTFGVEDPGPASFNVACQWVATTFAFASVLPIAPSGNDWIMALFIFLFVVMLTLGFFMPFVHIIDAVEGFIWSGYVWNVTNSIALTTFIAALSFFILVIGLTRQYREL